LNKLRGGNIPRVLFREQIISILADGAKKTSEIAEAIEGHPKAVNSELTRLVVAGDIVKVRRGMYALPTS
jgi:predicted transcriptional regulator